MKKWYWQHVSIYVYMSIAYSDLKKKQIFCYLQIPFAAALKLLTSCSSTPWVMTAWNMSIPLLYLFVWLLSIPLGKKEIFIILAADTIVSCTEAVDELFQHTLGHECMDSYVNIIAMCVYMSIACSAFSKKADFHSFSCRYHLQLHWSCWRAVPAHLG